MKSYPSIETVFVRDDKSKRGGVSMKLLCKLQCWLGWHPEYDLWLAGFHRNMFVKMDEVQHRDWGWFKIKYDDFGQAYYVTCRHCGKRL